MPARIHYLKAAQGCLLFFTIVGALNLSPLAGASQGSAQAALELLSKDKDERIYAQVKGLLAQRQSKTALQGLYKIYRDETNSDQIDGLYKVICLLDKAFCLTLAEQLAADYRKDPGQASRQRLLERLFRFKPGSQNNLHSLRITALHHCLQHYASVRGMATESSDILNAQCIRPQLYDKDALPIIQGLDAQSPRTERAAWLALALQIPVRSLSKLNKQRLIAKVKASVAEEYDDDLDGLAILVLCQLEPENQPDGNCPDRPKQDW